MKRAATPKLLELPIVRRDPDVRQLAYQMTVDNARAVSDAQHAAVDKLWARYGHGAWPPKAVAAYEEAQARIEELEAYITKAERHLFALRNPKHRRRRSVAPRPAGDRVAETRYQ